DARDLPASNGVRPRRRRRDELCRGGQGSDPVTRQPGCARRPGVHKVAGMPLPPAEADNDDTLRGLVLVRIASARSGLDKGVIAADLAPFAGPQMPASRWRGAV